MARDYKYRAQNANYGKRQSRSRRTASTPWWRWLLVAALIIVFVVFLNMVRSMVAELVSDDQPEAAEATNNPTVNQPLPVVPKKQDDSKETEKFVEPQPEPVAEPTQPEEPRYDFYTILPQAETVIPDYEIQSRVREELVGKTKATKYMMQAGSFREAADAERHKARLASLGIESRIENAKVGNVIWHRVKIGPYNTPSSVTTIKELLQKNGIDVVVTELGN
ncbi:MAG: SPOR domain-containing protein [Gammaproteobacteria bacterium]